MRACGSGESGRSRVNRGLWLAGVPSARGSFVPASPAVNR